MTVSVLRNKAQYTGNGSSTQFEITFAYTETSQIKVYLDGSLQTLTTHYTITDPGQTGTVTFVTAPESDVVISLIRETDYLQTVDYANNDILDAETLESAFDKLTMMCQQLKSLIDGSVGFDETVSDAETTSLKLAAGITDLAGKLLAFDATGNFVTTQEIGTWQGDYSASTAYVVRDIVKDPSTDNVYFTKQDAPAGTSLSNTTYFALLVDVETVRTLKEAAELAESNAETAQAASEAALASFQGQYKVGATNPYSGTPDAGDLWYDTTNSILKYYVSGTGFEPVTTSLATVTDNYLTISNQVITAGTVPISLGGTGSTTASNARTALGVDPAGTDNSTDVTLAGSLDYLTISGQAITRNAIDLTTDVTGALPVANGGTGSTTASGARTALGVDPAGTDNSTDVTLATVTGNYLSLSGQQITAGTVPVTLGGTGATTASGARTALGLAIGTDVQAYDADTAKYDDTTANFTGTLQNGGSNVLVDTDIGSTVQAYDADTAKYDAVTANFTGNLQNGGSNVVVDSDIGFTVQAYDADLSTIAGLSNVDGNFIVGSATGWTVESGATARTSLGLGTLATQSTITESQISDLQSYITASSIDTLTNKSGNISQWTNDSGYLTAETNDLTASVTWTNVPDVNITQSSVTQHQAALTITESQISDLQNYLTAETNDLGSAVTGTLAIANGGTSATTASAARIALLPTLGTAGQVLAVNTGATDVEWVNAAAGVGLGTVTSVAISGSDGIEVDSGSPITTSGTIALGINAATLSSHLSLGTAATTASTDYATAAQGALADSAVQPGDDANTLGSGAATDGYVLTADGAGGAAWEAVSAVSGAQTNTTNTFTANQIISVADNTNAALRITQTGTRDALLVEDSLNPDSTPFVVNTSGNVGIGTSSPQKELHIASNQPEIRLEDNSGTINYGEFIYTDGRLIIVSDKGNQLGSSTMEFQVDGAEYMRIDSSGNVGIGTTSPAQTLDVTGNINATGALTLGTALAVAEGGTGVTSLSSLDAADLGSGLATDGYVLTADGAGGAAWEAVSGGAASLPIDLLSSGASIRKSDGTTTVLSESSGAVTLENVTNAYLSGGVYLGGTTSSNYLDDYEEGTWTLNPSNTVNISSLTSTDTRYVKIGSLVMLTSHVGGSVASSTAETRLQFSLPFNATSTAYSEIGCFAFFIGSGANRFGIGTVYLGTNLSTVSNIYIAANQMNTTGTLNGRMTLIYQAA